MGTPLKTLLEGIKKGADDLMHIDVVTLTGDITLQDAAREVEGAGGAEPASRRFDLGSIYNKILDAAVSSEVETNINVVAFTRVEPDLDNVYFVKQGLSDAERELLVSHAEMVKTAQEGRIAFLKMIRDLLPL